MRRGSTSRHRGVGTSALLSCAHGTLAKHTDESSPICAAASPESRRHEARLSEGNVYCGGEGGILDMTEGQSSSAHRAGSLPPHIALGGAEWKPLYFTSATSGSVNVKDPECRTGTEKIP